MQIHALNYAAILKPEIPLMVRILECSLVVEFLAFFVGAVLDLRLRGMPVGTATYEAMYTDMFMALAYLVGIAIMFVHAVRWFFLWLLKPGWRLDRRSTCVTAVACALAFATMFFSVWVFPQQPQY